MCQVCLAHLPNHRLDGSEYRRETRTKWMRTENLHQVVCRSKQPRPEGSQGKMNSIHSHDREGSRQKDRVLATLVAVSATCWICALAGSVAAGPPAEEPDRPARETATGNLAHPPLGAAIPMKSVSYEVYCDGARAGTTSKTFYTVAGLKPDGPTLSPCDRKMPRGISPQPRARSPFDDEARQPVQYRRLRGQSATVRPRTPRPDPEPSTPVRPAGRSACLPATS